MHLEEQNSFSKATPEEIAIYKKLSQFLFDWHKKEYFTSPFFIALTVDIFIGFPIFIFIAFYPTYSPDVIKAVFSINQIRYGSLILIGILIGIGAHYADKIIYFFRPRNRDKAIFNQIVSEQKYFYNQNN